MEKADSCRRAAYEAVADVEPSQLHDRIEAILEEASMVPGVLTLESAAATASDGRAVPDADGRQEPVSDQDGDRSRGSERHDGIATQAAGVQLIYEGLRLTRSLAHDEPWTGGEPASADAGDLEILAADILVARGFYLLARTDAAGKAVRTVQAFGRDQSRRDVIATTDAASDAASTSSTDAESTDTQADAEGSVDATAIDANLERDILELAVLTGAAAVGDAPTPRLLATADSIADAVGTHFPPATDCLANLEPPRSDQSLEDHPTDRATSATDP